MAKKNNPVVCFDNEDSGNQFTKGFNQKTLT